MGWFGKKDKGYVSPFDAEATDDYIDPSTVLSADASEEDQGLSPASADADDYQKYLRDQRAQAADGLTNADTMPAPVSAPASTPLPPVPTSPQQPTKSSGTNPDIPDTSPAAASEPVVVPSPAPFHRNLPGDSSIDANPNDTARGDAQSEEEVAATTSNGRSVSAWIVLAFILLVSALALRESNLTCLIVSALAFLSALLGLISIMRHRELVKGAVRALLIMVLSAAMALSAGIAWHGDEGNFSFEDPSTSFADDNDDGSDADDYVPRSQRFPEFQSGALHLADYDGKSKVTITVEHAEPGPAANPYDESSPRTVIITYSVTNTGSKRLAMTDIADTMLFQDGIGSANAYLYPEYGDDVPDFYDRDSKNRSIKPGDTASVTIAFELPDPAKPFEIWTNDYSYNKVSVTWFSPTADGKGYERSEAQSDPTDLPALPDESELQTFAKVESYDGSTEYVRFVSAMSGPKDYNGTPTMIATYEWINTSKRPTSLSMFASFKARVGSQELERGYLDNGPIGTSGVTYDESSVRRVLQPNRRATVTVAFLLPASGGSFDVSLKMYADGSKPALSDTVTIDPSTAPSN